MDQILVSVLRNTKEALREAFLDKNEIKKSTSSATVFERFVGSTFLVSTALACVLIASYKFIVESTKKHKRFSHTTLTRHDTLMMPLILSGSLFVMFLLLKFVPQKYIVFLLSCYILSYGCISVADSLSMFINDAWPSSIAKNNEFSLKLECDQNSIFSFNITSGDIFSFLISALVTIGYSISKFWVLSNVIATGFSIIGISLIKFKHFSHAAILLIGLFIYDVFWVFGTNVMMIVATKIKFPLLFLFPLDLFEKGYKAENFSMLGLGDIVIPGIYIVFMLNYDLKMKYSYSYFKTNMIFYAIALIITNFIAVYFKNGQPALLYIVPCLLIPTLILSLVKRDFSSLMEFDSSPDQSEEEESSESVKPKQA